MYQIDIIIPAYNAHEIIEKTLFSIAYQVNAKEVKVYIVNEGSKEDYKKQVKFFSNFFKITELKLKKNLGLSAARQYGIDSSNSKYIMFINAGDMLASPTALKDLKESIKSSNVNIVSSYLKIKVSDDSFAGEENDIITLYGKMYERDFLEKHEIKFSNLNSNEDIGFNMLAYLNEAKTKTLPEYTYIKLSNESSNQAEDAESLYYNNIFSYIRNMTYALNTAIKQKCNKGQIAYFAFHTVISSYYYYLGLNSKIREEELLKSIKKVYNIHKKYPISEEKKEEIWYNQFILQNHGRGIANKLNPKISLEEFMTKIEKI